MCSLKISDVKILSVVHGVTCVCLLLLSMTSHDLCLLVADVVDDVICVICMLVVAVVDDVTGASWYVG